MLTNCSDHSELKSYQSTMNVPVEYGIVPGGFGPGGCGEVPGGYVDYPVGYASPEWSLWTSCSESCGPGSRQRTRRKACGDDGDGGLCVVKEDVEREACQEEVCPG